MELWRVPELPEAALAAAAHFHEASLPQITGALVEARDGLLLIFSPANHTHRAWRLAVVQSLAREHAPLRINAVESTDETAIAAALAYIGKAEGLTGQLLALDSHGAGPVV